MDLDGVPVGLDYTKVEAIDSRQRVAFLNNFITHTVNFLNRSVAHYEEKLGDIHVSMQHLNAQMDMFESRLRSIPGFDDIESTPSQPSSIAPAMTSTSAIEKSNETKIEQVSSDTAVVSMEDALPDDQIVDDSTIPVSKHPKYARFFNMVKYGVPIPAVKAKMAVDGLNPEYLDTPNVGIPKDIDIETDRFDNEASDQSEDSNESSDAYSDND